MSDDECGLWFVYNELALSPESATSVCNKKGNTVEILVQVNLYILCCVMSQIQPETAPLTGVEVTRVRPVIDRTVWWRISRFKV